MDLRHMRYFVTVANERSFTRAAERLHIAQPPLSRAIQQLEEEMGTRLIDREQRPLRLTAAGELFLEQAGQMLRRFDDLRVVMGRLGRPTPSRFVIGFVASTMYAALPDLIRRFRTLTPGLDLHFVELMSVEQIAALKDKRIDVGFGRLRCDDPAIRRDVLREERLVVALPVDHALARTDGPLSLGAIAREPLIVYPSRPRPSYADQVIAIYRDHGSNRRSPTRRASCRPPSAWSPPRWGCASCRPRCSGCAATTWSTAGSTTPPRPRRSS